MTASASASTSIHPTAIIDPAAELGPGVSVGAYCVIEGPVRLGAGTRLEPHAQVLGDTWLGEHNLVGRGAVLGGLPQDLRFDPATPTGVRIGDRNVLRELVTIHRATRPGTQTTIGHGNFVMVGAHFAHDCKVGDQNVIANNVLCAGHVEIGSRVVIAGGVPIHQFVRIGDLGFIGGLTAAGRDLPPYMALHGRSYVTGLNVVGLRRATDIAPAARERIRRAYKTLFRSGLLLAEALAALDADEAAHPCAEVRKIIDFCRATRRGVSKGGSKSDMEGAPEAD